ncbi:Superoxide dismutase [Cu-Zn] precursor [Planococcus halocryophilus Or1]|uniref:Superoxide dismutase [Cu-Zn] n=1 Tax=Planococcus halocryophilus TaxID=1215089 RepID=A0A1C7DSH3_9BACL|nr:superoxide dismutase family protein [Planococcus halocryophilus]ANU14241.1 superoxide dismutase [Planococcus halocryophilus]EMF46033.1 Superoxide dismutase [Cu-Zn] precursor [Planococcus halocryophilus Or1]
MKRWFLLGLLLTLFVFLAACGNDTTDEPPTESDGATETTSDDSTANQDTTESAPTNGGEIVMVTVQLINGDGNAIGTAELTDEEDGVAVALQIEDLEAGMHGIHFHQAGKCETPDFKSAGDHFNPENSMHGIDNTDGPHAGDLPNIEVGEDGTVSQEFKAENVTLEIDEENSLFKEGGTALVIHAGEDDQITDPSGDSGDRVACGVITAE